MCERILTPLSRVRVRARRESQAAAYELISCWTTEDHDYLRAEVPRTALRTPFRDGTLQDLAKQVCTWMHC